MDILLICQNCNWEIIPMLLGAWLIGLLFWIALFRNRNRKKIDRLSADLNEARDQLEMNKRDYDAVQYKNHKLSQDIADKNKLIKSYEFKIEQLKKSDDH